MDNKLGSEVALDSEGVAKDVNCVQEGNKRVSMRKRKPNSKYIEDDKDFDGSTKQVSDVDKEIKKASSRRRKANTKYSADKFSDNDVSNIVRDFDGSTKEASEVADEMKKVSSQKRKPNPKYNADNFVDYDVPNVAKDFDESNRKVSDVAEEMKTITSRIRKPNPKYSADNFVDYDVSNAMKDSKEVSDVAEEMTNVSPEKDDKSAKEVRDVAEEVKNVSSQKDFDKSAKEVNDVAEEMKRIPSRKRKPNPKYSVDNFVDYDALNAIKDSKEVSDVAEEIKNVLHEKDVDESAKEVSDVAEERKKVISQKRKPNTKYSVDNFVEYDASNAIKDVDGSTKQESDVAEDQKIVTSRKRTPNPKYIEDEGKLNEDGAGTHTLNDSEIVPPEGQKQNSSQKQKRKSAFSGEDKGIVPRGNKGVSLRKRSPNTNYNENTKGNVSDSSSDTIGNNGSDGDSPYVEDSPRKLQKNTTRRGSSKINEKTQMRKLTPEEYPPTDGMLKQLLIAARDPIKGYTLLSSFISFFADYRNSVSQNPKTSIFPDGVEGFNSNERMTENNSGPEIIIRETDGAGYDENTGKDYTPTAVIMFFADVDSVPSKSDLHHMFACYGPLNKSYTEVVKKMRRARVVFKRRSDADMALKRTGKFSSFGPSLVSYRLSYFYPD